MKRTLAGVFLSLFFLVSSSIGAAELLVSIGIRETGGTGPIGANGGASGGIEWVNLDGQTLTADGSWQLFTFTPSTDPLTAFAGASANGVLDVDWATLEHIRLSNTADGVTAYRVWFDDTSNTDSGGTETVDYEGVPPGIELGIQEPSFSGSTRPNLNTSTYDFAGVDDSMAFNGTQSYLVEFEFVDDAPTRWVRLTTFNAPLLPNPLVHVREAGAAAPTISFYAKAIAIPEPATCISLLIAVAAAVVMLRRRG